MPSYSAHQSVSMAATPQQCFDALTDYERLPGWQRGLRAATLVETCPDGAVVDYVLDAKVRTVRYRLRLTYHEPEAIDGAYLSGDLRRLEAGWRFAARAGGGTEVTLSIELDPGFLVPAPVRRVVQDIVMSRALRDLKTHLEAPSA